MSTVYEDTKTAILGQVAGLKFLTHTAQKQRIIDLEAKLKKAMEITYLQDHVMCYMEQQIQNIKEEDEPLWNDLLKMLEKPLQFNEFLDKTIDDVFQNDPFGRMGTMAVDMIRKDILDAQCGDGRRIMYERFKEIIACV